MYGGKTGHKSTSQPPVEIGPSVCLKC